MDAPPLSPSPGGRAGCGFRLLAALGSFALVVGGLAVVNLVRSAGTEEKPRTSASRTPPADFTTGGCVRFRAKPSPMHTTPDGHVMYTRGEYEAAFCDDPAAHARVTKMGEGTAVPELLGERAMEKLDCPIDTDEFAQLKIMNLPGDLACLRRLKPPHPGDPGQGGGLVRPGDCVQVHSRNHYLADVEVPCTNEDLIVRGTRFGKKWFGQVVGRADTARGCPRPAIYSMTLRAGTPRVLCIAKNGGWMPAVGDCVDSTTIYAGVNAPEDCREKGLTMKISALARPGKPCPGGARREEPEGYLVRMCLEYLD